MHRNKVQYKSKIVKLRKHLNTTCGVILKVYTAKQLGIAGRFGYMYTLSHHVDKPLKSVLYCMVAHYEVTLLSSSGNCLHPSVRYRLRYMAALCHWSVSLGGRFSGM